MSNGTQKTRSQFSRHPKTNHSLSRQKHCLNLQLYNLCKKNRLSRRNSYRILLEVTLKYLLKQEQQINRKEVQTSSV